MIDTVFTILLLLAVFSILMLIRNNHVYAFRKRLLDVVYKQSMRDIKRQKTYSIINVMWRYDVFSSVSYGEMMLKFWKPLRSFYPDTTFVKPYTPPAHATKNTNKEKARGSQKDN